MDESVFRKSVSLSSDVLVQELPDSEAIFLNLATEEYFGLDAVGTMMYRALVDNETVKQAHASLLEEFDIDADTLRRDLGALLDRLLDRNLVELHQP